MFVPGSRVCSLVEFHPVLQSLLKDNLTPNNPPVLCIEKWWGQELSGFVLTHTHAICLVWNPNSYTVKEDTRQEIVPLEDVCLVQETHVVQSACERDFSIDLVGSQQKEPLVRFVFHRQDSAYLNFLATLMELFKKCASKNAGNRRPARYTISRRQLLEG